MNNKNPAILSVQIIHGSLIMGVFTFLGVIFFLSQNNTPNTEIDISQTEMFAYISAAMLLIGIAVGQLLFVKMTGTKNNSFTADSADELNPIQLSKYTTAMIIRDALLEGPTLFSLVTLFLISGATGTIDTNLLPVQIILSNISVYFFLMLLYFPTEAKINKAFSEL